MRSIALLLTVLAVSAANAAVPNIYGVWTADLTRCDFGVPAHFDRLSVSVARVGRLLEIIEVAGGEAGAYIASRQYLFHAGLWRFGHREGRAKATDGQTVLHHSHQIERWSVSEDGSELTVKRWVDGASAARPQVLVFRRSSRAGE